LGNQLFIYFAGKFFENQTGQNVVFLDSKQASNGFSHLSSVRDFTISRNIRIENANHNWLSLRFRRQAYRLGEVIAGDKHRTANWSGLYRSPEIGFDENLRNLSRSKVVEGYFQCHEYFDHVMGLGHQKLTLVTESPWLIGMKELAQTEEPIMLHIRLGDYMKNQETIGVLSRDYYLQALDLVTKRNPNAPVWVFSDDPEQAEIYIGANLGEDSRFIAQPPQSTAAEAMTLMSLGSSLITSTSTFSWWAAKMCRSKQIVTPSQWFTARESPVGIHSDSWLTVESSWR
jgi:hypothetical protein